MSYCLSTWRLWEAQHGLLQVSLLLVQWGCRAVCHCCTLNSSLAVVQRDCNVALTYTCTQLCSAGLAAYVSKPPETYIRDAADVDKIPICFILYTHSWDMAVHAASAIYKRWASREAKHRGKLSGWVTVSLSHHSGGRDLAQCLQWDDDTAESNFLWTRYRNAALCVMRELALVNCLIPPRREFQFITELADIFVSNLTSAQLLKKECTVIVHS